MKMIFRLAPLVLILLLQACSDTSLVDQSDNVNQINSSQYPQITNAYNRVSHSLNGSWKYIIDQADIGYKRKIWENKKVKHKSDLLEYDFVNADSLIVPGDWNTQASELYYYEGRIWYQKEFDIQKKENKRYFLYFGAINYEAEVFLNGFKIGQHSGGFNPFMFEITETLLTSGNALILSVDNSRASEQIPTIVSDWKNFGGITREVFIIEEEETFIRDYSLQLESGSINTVEVKITVDGGRGGERISIRIPELGINEMLNTDAEGEAVGKFIQNEIDLWTPEDPRLYDVEFDLNGQSISDRIGFRTINVEGSDILLNGRPIFLKGICLHEENPFNNGRTISKTDARSILNRVKELNGNYLRLSHYPHNEHIVRLADEIGIMIWEEIPVYWNIDWEDPTTYQLAQNMLDDLITRDKNRASVIIWSVANETEISNARNSFLKKLIDFTRAKDNTRLVSAALHFNKEKSTENLKIVDDPFGENVDIIAVNQYHGWYDGLPNQIKDIKWQIDFEKPFVFSEFGAGALQGFHADSLTRWSEEYQEWYYKETLEMCERIDKLRGISPWILYDFQSPRRQLKKYQDGFNRKGLISNEGIKKKAFFVLEDYYLNKN